MKIRDLVRKFKDEFNDKKFLFSLNEVANYVTFEQAIIKKDNSSSGSTIKYRYEDNSYKYINDFFKEIKFISKPVIGTAKKVIIKNLPDEYKYQSKHEMSFSDKIYLLDKIKDSFMHLRNGNTLYDFDFSDGTIVINNQTDQYSLECKIPVSSLYKFNRFIKQDYDKNSPSLDWIQDFFNKNNKWDNIKRLVMPGVNYPVYEMKLPSARRAIFIPELNYFCFYQKTASKTGPLIQRATLNYDSYHTSSYVALLNASKEEVNFSLLDRIYDFDFHCEHPSYVSRMTTIIKNISNFYNSIYSNIDYMSHDLLKRKVLEFLYSIGQNGKENGLISDISDINNMIIKRFMRNARSHANTKVLKQNDLGNETIIYHDVLYNSLLNDISEKAVPNFAMIGTREEFNALFLEILKEGRSNKDIYDSIAEEFGENRKSTFNDFLRQLEKFIIQATKDGIEYSDYLNSPVGNASNFVDFLRKVVDGTFEYEDGKCIRK